MDVYLLASDADRYENLTVAEGADVNALLDGFDGRPMRKSWSPLEVEVIRDSRHSGRPESDFPLLFGPVPVLSDRAARALGELLDGAGELLPLGGEGDGYHILNVTRVIDALDEQRSQFKRFPSSGRIMRVLRYAFRPEAIGDVAIFKLPQTVKSDVYVTDRFVDAVRRHELTGLAWDRMLWSETRAEPR
jgi:hypothetical protein